MQANFVDGRCDQMKRSLPDAVPASWSGARERRSPPKRTSPASPTSACRRLPKARLSDVAVRDMGLNERATHALYDAFFAREVTNRYYRGMADVSEVTASHDLAKLVASGALE